MRRTLDLIGLSVILSVAATETIPCCFPDRVEGEMFFAEKQASFFFAIDYPAQRLLNKPFDNPEVTTILDLSNGRLYDFDEQGCRYRQGSPEKLAQCITGRKGDGHILNVGELGNRKPFAYYWLQFSDGYVQHLVTRQGRECNLFVSRSLTGTDSKTVIYSELKNTITFTEIYNSFDNCTNRWA